jgi:nitrogen fixation NifU-like protein
MSEIEKFLEESGDVLLEQVRKQYSRKVVSHLERPRNPYAMDAPDGHANRVGACGDNIEIFLRVRGDRIVKASFMTEGCVASIASGSMAVELATGMTLEQARSVSQDDILEGLGGLPDDSEHCAELAAEALRAAVVDCIQSGREPWKRLYRPR